MLTCSPLALMTKVGRLPSAARRDVGLELADHRDDDLHEDGHSTLRGDLHRAGHHAARVQLEDGQFRRPDAGSPKPTKALAAAWTLPVASLMLVLSTLSVCVSCCSRASYCAVRAASAVASNTGSEAP